MFTWKTLGPNDKIKEIRYVIFVRFVFLAGVSSLIFSFVNTILKRPFINFALAFITALIYGVSYFTAKDERNYQKSRILMLIYSTFILIPTGFFISAGSDGSILLLILLIILIETLIIIKPWEFMFPILIIAQTLILLKTEHLLNDILVHFSNDATRIQIISTNFALTGLSIVIIIAFMMRNYFIQIDVLHLKTITDSLTNLYNRKYFYEYSEMEIARSKRKSLSYSLVFIDLNNFKKVNDIYGHLEGDEVLIEVAEIISESIRVYDVAARYGGDEFTIFLPDTNHDEASSYVTRISEHFEDYCSQYNDISFSIGITFESSSELSIEELISKTEENLFKNKKNHKN
jgi:diguanylate cyclase (GGDEF)-like protein